MSNPIKKLCVDMAEDPIVQQNILTFTDIAKAAADGAAAWHDPHSAWIGAVLGVSLEASKRAVRITEGLIAAVEPESDDKSQECAATKTGKPKKPKP